MTFTLRGLVTEGEGSGEGRGSEESRVNSSSRGGRKGSKTACKGRIKHEGMVTGNEEKGKE